MKVVAGMIVRGEGSTLKGKNTYPVLGKPMLQWCLEAAKACDWIDHIWVWTDDEKAKSITETLGCVVIARSRDQLYYHGDTSNPIEWKKDREDKIVSSIGTLGDVRVSLNCNLCLITPELLYQMYVKLMEDPIAGNVVPVYPIDPYLFTENQGRLFPVFHQFGLDRQGYPPLYRMGGIHIEHTKRYESKVSLKTVHYVTKKEYLLDVHTLEDIRLAEYYLIKRAAMEERTKI